MTKEKLSPDFIKKLKEQKQSMQIARSSVFTSEKSTEVLNKIQTNCNLNDREEALTFVSLLFHQGGTARKCDGNLSATIFGKTVKLAEIRRALRECNVSKAERKLARSHATTIREICLTLEIPGNLSSKIQRSNPDLNLSDIDKSSWLSEFQLENPDCPTELRKLISTALKPSNNTKSNQGSNSKNR